MSINKAAKVDNHPPILVIYHAHCPDGFAAALAAKQYFQQQQLPQPEWHAAVHSAKPPEVSNKSLYLLDFCYPYAIMRDLCQQAESVVIIDHHISVQEDLYKLTQEFSHVQIHFDLNHSAAVLSWQYFFTTPLPDLFRYIEDRDIWKHEFSQTNDILAAIMSWPMSFEHWQAWLDNTQLESLIAEGKILNRERNKMIHKYSKRTRMGLIAGYQVPVVNAPGSIASDLLQKLARGYPFAASYEDREDKRVWQLRATQNGIDVSHIARLFGGGGHQKASGFFTRIEPVCLEILENK